MSYTVRFESNRFQADSAIQRLLDGVKGLDRRLQRFAGIRIREVDGLPTRKLYGINGRVFEAAMDWADADFDQQMIDDQWKWKGPNALTRRRNGEIVGEPRDIVDTGELIQSKKRVRTDRNAEEFRWMADHAGKVHDGYMARDGSIYPPRPWTQPTLDAIDEAIKNIADDMQRGR
jgi:hypothetical protein